MISLEDGSPTAISRTGWCLAGGEAQTLVTVISEPPSSFYGRQDGERWAGVVAR